MFAVARHFEIEEARKAFRLFVCWSVRFLIAGGRGGLLDTNYAKRAHEVGEKKVTTAMELSRLMSDVVPGDTAFEAAFATARVSQNYLARYYLRVLELQVKEDPQPELVPNEDQEAINLEHVLPLNPSSDWSVDEETASACHRRLGNLVLLQATANTAIGNAAFSAKKPTLDQSAYYLTKMIAQHGAWGAKEIADRQKKLAEYAVKAWPLMVR
jgi:hypothetical protein